MVHTRRECILIKTCLFSMLLCNSLSICNFLLFTVPPRFLGQISPTWQVKDENTSVSYSCVSEAKPAATIQWVLNGKNLTNSQPYNISGSFQTIQGSKLLKTFGYLDIPKLTWRQYGNFSCIAHNEAGHVRQNTELEVRCKYKSLNLVDWSYSCSFL